MPAYTLTQQQSRITFLSESPALNAEFMNQKQTGYYNELLSIYEATANEDWLIDAKFNEPEIKSEYYYKCKL